MKDNWKKAMFSPHNLPWNHFAFAWRFSLIFPFGQIFQQSCENEKIEKCEYLVTTVKTILKKGVSKWSSENQWVYDATTKTNWWHLNKQRL